MTYAHATTKQLRSEHDVVMVGARCAGAATALLLARQGFDVALVDRAAFPSDTLSTHALARGGMVQLARWGLLDQVVASGAPVVRAARFHYPDGTRVEKVIKSSAGVSFLLAPRRHVLDPILLGAAIDAGARFEARIDVTGTIADRAGRVTGITARDANGSAREIRASFVVGADGVRSRIARAVHARTIEERPSTAGVHYAYAAGLDARAFEFHIADGAFSGVFPTHDGEANVWVCAPAEPAHERNVLRADEFVALLERTAPRLASRVRRAHLTSPVRGASRLPNRVLEAAGEGWALVGDAGYHRDPITGHGMTDALRDAELLADALGRALRGEESERDALRAYADARGRALAPIFDITCRLAQFPEPTEFIALQKQLSAAIDAEAAWLAARPDIVSGDPVAA